MVTRVLDGTGAMIEPYGGVAIGNVSEASLPRCPRSARARPTTPWSRSWPDLGCWAGDHDLDRPGGQPVPGVDKAPPDATLTIDADEPVPVAADTMRFASAEAGSLSLGAAQPYVERSFTVTMPATEPVASPRLGSRPRRSDRGRVASRIPAAGPRGRRRGRRVGRRAGNLDRPAHHLPADGCESACEATYDVGTHVDRRRPERIGATTRPPAARVDDADGCHRAVDGHAGWVHASGRHGGVDPAPLHLRQTIEERGRIQEVLTATLDLGGRAERRVQGLRSAPPRRQRAGTSGEEGRLEYSLGAGPNLHAEPGAPMRAVSPVHPD